MTNSGMHVEHEPADVRARFHEFRYTTTAVEGPLLRLRYELAGAIEDLPFEEVLEFPAGTEIDPAEPGAAALIRLLHLAAGLSYYKAAAPPQIVVSGGLSKAEDTFLRELVLRGLGEFAYRNALPGPLAPDVAAAVPDRAMNHHPTPPTGAPLVPVGGGKDSVVTLETLRRNGLDPVAFSVNSFAPIAATAETAGVQHLVVKRTIDPRLLALNGTDGFLNGHVPVTAINSLVALLTARAHGLGPVVMSNELSAGSGNVRWRGLEVNHQYSKSWDFEQLLRETLADAGLHPDSYFSFLRPLSEFEIARRFSQMTDYHPVFTSCNRAFRLDPTRRGTRWCGECSKCRFVFLILSPFMSRTELTSLIGRDLLDDDASLEDYRDLLGLDGHKPFECVGEVEECRVALMAADATGQWAGADGLIRLTTELAAADLLPDSAAAERLCIDRGPGALPAAYQDLLRAAP
jgi:hypothetical protein